MTDGEIQSSCINVLFPSVIISYMVDFFMCLILLYRVLLVQFRFIESDHMSSLLFQNGKPDECKQDIRKWNCPNERSANPTEQWWRLLRSVVEQSIIKTM